MNKKLTCNQVSALINFYLENKLNPSLKEAVEEHLENCPHCKKKILELKKILNNYTNNKINSDTSDNTKESEILNQVKLKLSEYLDNELNSNENLKIKKSAITNPTIRKELENMYKLKQLMKHAYEKTQNDVKYDYSKIISAKVQGKAEYSTNYFYKIAAVFGILITSIICCFIYLYF